MELAQLSFHPERLRAAVEEAKRALERAAAGGGAAARRAASRAAMKSGDPFSGSIRRARDWPAARGADARAQTVLPIAAARSAARSEAAVGGSALCCAAAIIRGTRRRRTAGPGRPGRDSASR